MECVDLNHRGAEAPERTSHVEPSPGRNRQVSAVLPGFRLPQGSRRNSMFRVSALLGCSVILVLLAACNANAHPVVKLGVIAPFEGAGRPLGYAILPAVKQAAAAANQRGELGAYRVQVVAFNDDLNPGSAVEQARALALDGDVLAIVGPFTPDTAAAVAPVFREARLASVAVVSAEPGGEDHAAEVSDTQEAANALLSALAADIRDEGRPSRAGVAARLPAP